MVLGLAVPASGGAILQGASSSPQGSFGGAYAIENAGNQSGLSAGYVSGFTSFDGFVSVATHSSPDNGANSGFTASNGVPQQFTFDLGAIHDVDGFAFWSTDNIGSVTSFELFADNDGNFGNGGLQSLGFFNVGRDAGSVSSAQVGSFGWTTTQYFHVNVLGMDGGTGLTPGIGEMAFRQAPEPGSIVLLGLGALGLATVGLRRRKSRA